MKLQDFIQKRLDQLKNRKLMIPRYVKQPGSFVGKKDFSLSDLPKIDEEIEECKICLKALEILTKRT